MISPCINRVRYSKLFNRQEYEIAQDITSRLQASPAIFVFQMGKVASTAIYCMLSKSNYPGLVLHGHRFDPFHPSLDIRTLYQYYSNEKPRIKIISLVREPISRNVSAFFQNLKRDSGLHADCKKIDVLGLKKKFLNNYPHEVPLIWFDQNIKRHFGIDVYDYKFPDRGHIEIIKGNVELLVMRHDLPDATKIQLVSEFTEIQDLKIRRENAGQDKVYSDLYEQFKKTRLPLSHLHYLASSKYMKHFFFPEMRQILTAWSEEPLPGSTEA